MVGVSQDLSQIIKAYDVRGVVPDQFDDAVARAVGAAFARVVVVPEWADVSGDEVVETHRPAIVIGHDMRESGPGLVAAFADGVTSAGVDVTLIGLCSTDGLYHASGSLHRPGAMFTASHNPAEYNGIKMCRAGARPVGLDSGLATVRELAQQYLDDGLPEPAPTPGTTDERDLLADYSAFLRGLVDISRIRPLKVVVDAGNGMGGYTAPAVLGTAAGLPELPLDVVPLYWELDGSFPNHEANPSSPRTCATSRPPSSSTTPTSASRSTGTPTAASSSTSTATPSRRPPSRPSWACARSRRRRQPAASTRP
ncbi:hypothetical protein GCM10025865_21540 [Paraoerskovia sediminicola]|uniref:Phosphomannomutase/phosphoglucomutase n=1 Tax=Paraoerskovia sediminicola TaxID=1138587 RepID=A0ABN6XGC5_9CELL|nr:hypothetical protein GCM10025865_21540 [Paraoerskovia sediminicola]